MYSFTIFKYYPLADGHGAVIVYLFFLLNVLVLHLSIIPFLFIKKKKKNIILDDTYHSIFF